MDDLTFKERHPRWSIWDVALVLAALLLLLPISAMIKKPLVMFLTKQDFTLSQGLMLLIGTTVQAGIMISTVLILLRRKGAGFRDLGFIWVRPGYIFTGLWSGILLCFAVIGAGVLMTFIAGPPPPQDVELLLKGFKEGKDMWLPFISISILAPISEEIYFRGMAYPVFRTRFGPIPAMVVSGLFFGSLHMDLYRLLPISLGGIGLAYLYERSGSLVTPIIAHSVWNTLMLVLLYMASNVLQSI